MQTSLDKTYKICCGFTFPNNGSYQIENVNAMDISITQNNRFTRHYSVDFNFLNTNNIYDLFYESMKMGQIVDFYIKKKRTDIVEILLHGQYQCTS